MEQSDLLSPENKIYPAKAIWLGTFLGGPLVTGYLMAINYKAFNEPAKVKNTWILSSLVTFLLVGILYLNPNPERIPKLLIPIASAVVAGFLVRHYQTDYITAHIQAGGPSYDIGRVFVISLLGIMATLFSVFIFQTIKNIGSEHKVYGSMEHEIHYNKHNISEAEVDQLANALTKTFFFDQEFKKYAHAKKVTNTYEISLICECVKSDTDFSYQIQLRKDLQKFLSSQKIVLNLCKDDYNQVIKQLE